MDKLEEQEMKKSKFVVKNKLNKWYDWIVDYVRKSIKSTVFKAFSNVKNSILSLYDDTKRTLTDAVEIKVKKENQE